MKKFWDVILGMILILYVIAINIMSGVIIAFSLPIVILGIIFIVYHFVRNKIKENKFSYCKRNVGDNIYLFSNI